MNKNWHYLCLLDDFIPNDLGDFITKDILLSMLLNMQVLQCHYVIPYVDSMYVIIGSNLGLALIVFWRMR